MSHLRQGRPLPVQQMGAVLRGRSGLGVEAMALDRSCARQALDTALVTSKRWIGERHDVLGRGIHMDFGSSGRRADCDSQQTDEQSSNGSQGHPHSRGRAVQSERAGHENSLTMQELINAA